MNDSCTDVSHDDALHVLRELLEADFGDWEAATVREWAASRPGWEQGPASDGQAVITPGRAGTTLLLDAGGLGFDSTRYAVGRVPLLEHRYRSDAGGAAAERTTALARALATVGDPVRYEDGGGAPGLRWRGERHTVIFQSNRRAGWLAVHPVSPLHREAADAAESLHDGGRPGDRSRVLSYAPNAGLAERGAAFGALLDAVVGRIGSPTVLGASADGPGVRWRDERRLLILSGDHRGALLQVHDTEELEGGEHRDFEWGGPWGADEPSDFSRLPYLWQLDRGGPGWSPDVFPGGRLARNLDHLQEGLRLLLASFVEHLPPQVGRHWSTFTITHDGRDAVRLVFDPDRGLRVLRTDRAERDSAGKTAAMRELGWQERERWCWTAAFPEPTEDSAAEAARLVVAQLRADGVRDPGEECGQRDVSCNDMGAFDLYGCGVGR